MAVIQRPDVLRDTHCFGLAYLMYAHASDGWLDSTETNTIVEKILEWTGGKGTREGVIADLNESLAWYQSLVKSGDKDVFVQDISRVIGGMSSALGKDQLKAVIEDLRAISQADGKVTERELEMIKAFEKDFGL